MLKTNFSRLLALALALTVTLFCLVSCGTGEIDAEGTVTVVIFDTEATEYTVSLDSLSDGEGLIPLLDYLKAEEGVDYTATDAGYGAYLTSLGTLKENATEGKYLYVYTSVEADFDVSAYAKTVEYDGKTLTSSGVGISEMSLTDGAVIYFTYITY